MWDPGHYTYLTMFINHCQNVFQDLECIDKRIEQFTGKDLSMGSERQEIKKTRFVR